MQVNKPIFTKRSISNITQYGFAGGQGGEYQNNPTGGGGGGGAAIGTNQIQPIMVTLLVVCGVVEQIQSLEHLLYMVEVV